MKITNNILHKTIDPNVGEYKNYLEVSTLLNGQSIADSDVDGTIYIKSNNVYYRRANNSIVDIREFGGKGDGITDNTLAFQKAIDYLLKDRGGVLLIPTGIFLIKGRVYINAPSHIPITIRGTVSKVRNDNSLLSGSSIRRDGIGDIFWVNLKPDGTSFLDVNAQYGAFAVENLNFSAVGSISGVTAFRMFRTRCKFSNITTQRLDYLVFQPDTDSAGAGNYCDQSCFEFITFTNSTKGGLRLRNADSSRIDMIFIESVTATFENLITLLNTRSATVSNILHWTPTVIVPVSGSSLITLLTCSNIHISSMHFERVNTENIFTLGTCRGLTIIGLDQVFSSNTVFNFGSNNRNINISNWNASSDLNSGYYDIVVGAGTTNREITLYDYELLAANGSTLRQININNLSTRQGGALRFNQLEPYIIDVYDNLILERTNITVFLHDASDQAIKTINLPSAVTNKGKKILFVNKTTSTTYTIPSLNNFYIPRDTSTELIPDGTNWSVTSAFEGVRHISVAGSANYTVPYYNAFLTLNNPTADRVLTLPESSIRQGALFIVHNIGTNLNRWSISGVRLPNGTTGVYYFDPGTITSLRSVGSVYDIVSITRANPKRTYTTLSASTSVSYGSDIIQLNPITGTADQTLTLPSADIKNGETITIVNRNENPLYKWLVSPSLRWANGLDFNSLPNNMTVEITSDNTVYRVTGSTGWIDGAISVSGSFNGSATVINFPHGLGTTPVWFNVTPTSVNAAGLFYVTANSSNIIITYLSAPSAGTATYNISYRK